MFRYKNFISFSKKFSKNLSYNPKYNICIVDIESSGLSAVKDRIIEIGAIKVVDGVVIGMYGSLINQNIQIQPNIINITKITQEMVDRAPSPVSVLFQFSEFLGDSVFVGHNSTFDATFIIHEMNRYGIPLPACLNQTPKIQGFKIQKFNIEQQVEEEKIIIESFPILCTLKIAKRLLPNLTSYKLSNLAEYYSFPPSETHRAVSDCQITVKVFQMLHIEATKKLGFSPKIDFFHKLSNTPIDKVSSFISNYRE